MFDKIDNSFTGEKSENKGEKIREIFGKGHC